MLFTVSNHSATACACCPDQPHNSTTSDWAGRPQTSLASDFWGGNLLLVVLATVEAPVMGPALAAVFIA